MSLNSVGIKNFISPINLIDKENNIQPTIANISMFVDLPENQRATHMSRFIEILKDDSSKIFDLRKTPLILKEMKKRFNCKNAHINVSAPYFTAGDIPEFRCNCGGKIFKKKGD